MDVRPATRNDLPAIAELFGSVEEHILGRPSTLVAEAVEGWLHSIAFETNTWLFEEDGQLVAAGFAERHGDRAGAAGAVRPSAQGRGLGTRIVELTGQRMTEEGAPRIHAWALAGDERAAELFARHGYREVRRFWDMAIELDGDVPDPGAVVEPVREEEMRGYHAAIEEAFEDHWEPHPEAFETWWVRQQSRATFDPSLWFVIRDGDELAAVIRNEARGDDGYVGVLGVRRQWRGRGYGKALLRHSFREFRRRGLTRASLGVDASSPTGATKLYESVGMYVEQENVVWEKVLT
jgi:ribosomal protein S18 acetylase RimI-like enzyme